MNVQKDFPFSRLARYIGEDSRKKASEATLMYGLSKRLKQPRYLFCAALSIAALAALLALWALSPQNSAAHPKATNATVIINFTVTVQAGTPPDDVLFWVCPDAQTDGTGCDEMNSQPDGTFIYQLTTTTGTTHKHVIIEWSHGRLPGDQGSTPTPPAHIVCDYHPFEVEDGDPLSYTCKADFTALDVTPTPPDTNGTATPTTNTDPPGPTSGDNSTLVTGLQIIIGVGLFLFVVLLIIFVWQRVGTQRRS
jgi:hypothetical protein